MADVMTESPCDGPQILEADELSWHCDGLRGPSRL